MIESKHHTADTVQDGLLLLAREGQQVSGITIKELYQSFTARLLNDTAAIDVIVARAKEKSGA